jgi:hypothetical protein
LTVTTTPFLVSGIDAVCAAIIWEKSQSWSMTEWKISGSGEINDLRA